MDSRGQKSPHDEQANKNGEEFEIWLLHEISDKALGNKNRAFRIHDRLLRRQGHGGNTSGNNMPT